MPITQDRCDLKKMEGSYLPGKVAASTILYAGMLCNTNAAGYTVVATDTAGELFTGFTFDRHYDNSGGDDGDVVADIWKRGAISVDITTAVTQANMGAQVGIKDGQTVDLLASTTNHIYCGNIVQVLGAHTVQIMVDQAINENDLSIHIANATGAHAASAVSLLDAGLHTATINVETALAEIYVDLESGAEVLAKLSASSGFTQADGTPILKLASDAYPGLSVLGSDDLVLAWTAEATPLKAMIAVPLAGSGIDLTKNVTVTVRAAMSGTSNTPTLAVGAYFGKGTSNKGGTTAAITGTALANYTVTIALADLPASLPELMTLTLTPQAGAMGTDNLQIASITVTGTRKLRTS